MSFAHEQPIAFGCDGETLVGVLHSPARDPSGEVVSDGREVFACRLGVLIVVGGPQYRVGSHRQFVLMARTLARYGFSVFRFDYRGMGDSGGEPRIFEHVDSDIRAAIDAFLRAEPALGGIVLWGLCDAASACLLYCNADPRVRALILVNPWVRTTSGEARARLKYYYGRRLFERSFWSCALAGRLNVLVSIRGLLRSLTDARAGSADKVSKPFVTRMRDGLRWFVGPVLFLVSERDLTAREFVDLAQTSREWKALLGRPTTCIAHLTGTDHTFSSRETLDRATEECRKWLVSLRLP